VRPTLKVKIIAGCLVATTVLLAVGVLAVGVMSDLRARDEAAFRSSKQQIDALASIDYLTMEGLATSSAMLFGSGAVQESARVTYGEQARRATEELVALGDEPLSPEARSRYDELVTSISWWNRAGNYFFQLDLPVPDPTVPETDLARLIREYEPRGEELRENLAALRDQITADADAASAVAAADATSSLRRFMVVVGVAGVVMVAAGLWLSSRLVRRLRRAVTVLQRVADGDLTTRLEDDGNDEVGEMAVALNTSVGAIHDVVRQIERDADTLARLAKLGVAKERAVSSADAGTTMTSSYDSAADLAEMAENLDAMIGTFVLEHTKAAGEELT
jgi:methyl-accepting chemotaxis protein